MFLVKQVFFILFIFTGIALAQGGGEPYWDLDSLVILLPVISALVLTQLLKFLLYINRSWKMFISFVIAVGMALVGFYFGWGEFSVMIWWEAALYGVMGGLVANGIFDRATVQFILNFILGFIGKEKTG